jgi:hypothetical protein
MSAMKYTLAMVAAGGAMGLASQAGAVTTVTLNIGANDAPTDIFLAGASSAQFDYGFLPASGGDPDKSAMHSFGKANKLDPNPFTTPDLPHHPGSIGGFFYDTVKGGVPQQAPGDFYLHLKFSDDLGARYMGSAHFDGADTLESITFKGAVPEPDTWALLIAGMGLAGAALRRQRRRPAQAAIG